MFQCSWELNCTEPVLLFLKKISSYVIRGQTHGQTNPVWVTTRPFVSTWLPLANFDHKIGGEKNREEDIERQQQKKSTWFGR